MQHYSTIAIYIAIIIECESNRCLPLTSWIRAKDSAPTMASTNPDKANANCKPSPNATVQYWRFTGNDVTPNNVCKIDDSHIVVTHWTNESGCPEPLTYWSHDQNAIVNFAVIINWLFLNENLWYFIKISLRYAVGSDLLRNEHTLHRWSYKFNGH